MQYRAIISRRSLTLIELIVVLFIIAALATVALTTTSEVVDQSLFQVSQRRSDQLRDAVVGAGLRQPDGTPISLSFVADIGRLPRAHADEFDDDGNPVLSPGTVELTVGGFPSFSIQQTTADTDIRLGCGWRGPYIQTPNRERVIVGGEAFFHPTFVDGYGNLFLALRPDGSDVTAAGQDIGTYIAPNADRKRTPSPATDPYSEDFRRTFSDSVLGIENAGSSLSVHLWKGEVGTPLSATDDRGNPIGRVYVVLYRPQNGVLDSARFCDPVSDLPPADAIGDPTEEDDQMQVYIEVPTGLSGALKAGFVNETIGPRVIRAYQRNDNLPGKGRQISSPLTSRPRTVILPRGGLAESIDLVLD